MSDKPFRLTRGKLAVEVSLVIILVLYAWRFFTWGIRRWKPLAYHPIAIFGLLVFVATYALSPWITAALSLGITLAWPLLAPDSYLHHVNPRAKSFLAGFHYRHRPRRKLTANGLLNDQDPVPTISRVTKAGCVTKIRIKMSHGDSIDYWRHEDRPSRIAQTYGALDCKINPYRRDNFTTVRLDKFTTRPPFVKIKFKEKITKARWLELEFLTKDPFARPVGFEYIDYHRVRQLLPENGSPVGPGRDGFPHLLKVRTHRLSIAMSGRGKSNAERAMVYTDYPAVMAGMLENWGFDGKRGTEIRFMEHCFAHHEYGLQGPQMVAQFFAYVEQVGYQRLDDMGGNTVMFEPEPGYWDGPVWVPGKPIIDLYIDEIRIFETEAYAQFRKQIYSSLSVIQFQFRAAGIRIKAFTNNPKLEHVPLRDDFPELEIGGLLNRRQIDTAMAGGWDLGAREVPEDLPGVFYVKKEAGMALEQFRYAHDRENAIRALPRCPPSSLWKPGQKQLTEVLIA